MWYFFQYAKAQFCNKAFTKKIIYEKAHATSYYDMLCPINKCAKRRYWYHNPHLQTRNKKPSKIYSKN